MKIQYRGNTRVFLCGKYSWFLESAVSPGLQHQDPSESQITCVLARWPLSVISVLDGALGLSSAAVLDGTALAVLVAVVSPLWVRKVNCMAFSCCRRPATGLSGHQASQVHFHYPKLILLATGSPAPHTARSPSPSWVGFQVGS